MDAKEGLQGHAGDKTYRAFYAEWGIDFIQWATGSPWMVQVAETWLDL